MIPPRGIEQQLMHKYFSIGIFDGAEYLVFVSSRSLKKSEKYTNWDNLVCLNLYIFWGKCVYFSIFEWWKRQMDFLT